MGCAIGAFSVLVESNQVETDTIFTIRKYIGRTFDISVCSRTSEQIAFYSTVRSSRYRATTATYTAASSLTIKVKIAAKAVTKLFRRSMP